MEEKKMNITFEEALAVCVQYYVNRGNPVELATTIVNRGEKEVLALFHAIQGEKEMSAETAIIVSLTQTDDSIPAETLTADR